MPGSLVCVRRYPYREAARSDQQCLNDAGIETYLKWGEGGNHGAVELLVAEAHGEHAQALLSSSPQLLYSTRDERLPACPACRARDADPRPPYALMIFAAGAAVGIGVAVLGEVGPALGLMTAAGVASAIAYARAPRWRCRKCGRLYGATEA